jgi:hypothetical protein
MVVGSMPEESPELIPEEEKRKAYEILRKAGLDFYYHEMERLTTDAVREADRCSPLFASFLEHAGYCEGKLNEKALILVDLGKISEKEYDELSRVMDAWILTTVSEIRKALQEKCGCKLKV